MAVGLRMIQSPLLHRTYGGLICIGKSRERYIHIAAQSKIPHTHRLYRIYWFSKGGRNVPASRMLWPTVELPQLGHGLQHPVQ